VRDWRFWITEQRGTLLRRRPADHVRRRLRQPVLDVLLVVEAEKDDLGLELHPVGTPDPDRAPVAGHFQQLGFDLVSLLVGEGVHRRFLSPGTRPGESEKKRGED
jgi:hypothetical protein